MDIQANQTLLMIGDSVTDCGRARPIGEGLGDACGNGYPALVRALLDSCYPERNIRVINMGTSGDTVRDLGARWQADVLDLRPDWITIMIGINDVWRQFDSPTTPHLAVPPGEYEATLSELVAAAKALPAGVVVMTPYFMEPLRADKMRARMDEYGAAAVRVAAAHNARLVDTQALFDRLFEDCYTARISWDRVHPNLAGHMLLARALLKALNFDR